MAGRKYSDVLIVLTSVLFLVVCLETAFRISNPVSIDGAYIAAVITNVPIQLGVLAVVLRHRRATVFEEYGSRILRSSVLGIALIGVTVGGFAPVLYDRWYDQVATVRWALTIGLGGGFYAGYQYSRVIAQRVAAERAEVRAEEAAQRQELLEYINALLRHEVLNAVNVIQGRAVLLRRKLSDDPETVTQLETIERQSDEMSDIVDDVRTLLRANQQELEFSRVEITEMVRDSLLKFEDRYQELETTVQLSDEAFVEASDLLPRVFDNLFRNAIEHNDSSPVRITVMSVKTDDRVIIEIGDNGPGIPERLHEDLFAPAIGQSDDQARLGTVIVGRLVEQHGGEVGVLETGPDGTTIEVTLPLASA